MTLIRPATAADEPLIRDIDFHPVFPGESMNALIDDRSLFVYAMSLFLPSAGGIAFLTESENGIVGYTAVSSSRWITARTSLHSLPARILGRPFATTQAK